MRFHAVPCDRVQRGWTLSPSARRRIGLTGSRAIPDATSVSSLIPGLRAKTPADLQRARERVPWVDDDDLRELERKSTGGAMALSFFTWGGGHLYLGDTRAGIGLLVALLGCLMFAGPVAPALYLVIGALSAAWSYRKAQDVNRFVGTRNEVLIRQGTDASAYRLLHEAAAVNPALAATLPAAPALLPAGAAPGTGGAMPGAAAGPPGPHAELVARLRKLASLRQAGVISDAELRSRKIDLLGDAAPASADALDDLLYALLPLANEGVLDTDDFDFIKQLGSTPGRLPGDAP
jgi:hypothetical protein